MVKKEMTNILTTVHKTHFRTLKIEQHEPPQKTWGYLGCSRRVAYTVPRVAPNVLNLR